MKSMIAIALFVTSLTASASSIYGYCISMGYKLPEQMAYSFTISTCFKAHSILPKDAGNIAQSFCRGAWAESVGLTYTDSKGHYWKAAEGVHYDGTEEGLNTMKKCEEDRARTLAGFRGNATSESRIQNKPILVQTFNGIVPNIVTGTKFETIRLFCKTKYCQDL